MSLPAWKGASVCYRRAMSLLAFMGANGHVKPAKPGKWTRHASGLCSRPYRADVSPEMRALIEGLNKGDEEQIKGTLLNAPATYPGWKDPGSRA